MFIACPTEGGGGSSGGKTIDDIVIPVIQEDFFVIDGEFDLDALLLELEDFEITVNYSDGTSTTVGIGDCTISGFDPDVEGEQEITVSFGGKSVSFAVYVYSADNFVAVEGVSLNKTAVTLEAGGSETLVAVIDPEDASEKRVRWESDNPALAAVNAYGVINVPEDAEEGTVNITVTTIDGGLTATCVVTVTTDGEPTQNLENLTVGLTAGDGKVTLAAQTAAAGFAFYYNKSDASVAAPAYGDAITTITGATAYSAATDIAGPNGTAIYVQVYKVEITGNTIVGFGQANRIPTATPDNIAPIPGNSGAITTASVTDNSLTLDWAKATDDITAPADLLYFVYQKDSAFSMSGGLPTDGNLLNAGGTADIATYNVTGLSAVTSYYFIVVVEDEAGNRAAYAEVSETTAAALTYEISASTLTSFGSLVEGYEQPDAKTVTITNTGTGAVTLNQPTATDYDIGTLSTTSLAAGAIATFTVQPKAGLAEGNYDETITITSSGDAETSVDAEFTVLPSKTVSVGMQSGTLTAGMAGTVTFPVTTVNIANGSYTVTVANLPEGVTVQGQVTIDSNSGELTLAGDTSTEEGDTETLTLTIDGATSGVFTLTIAIKVATPTAVPAGGNVVSGDTIQLSTTTTGAQIRYTLDSTEPTVSSTLYSDAARPAITGAAGTTVTLKAIAIMDDAEDSDILTATYTLLMATVATPQISSPAGTTVDSGTQITLTCATDGATIYYTLDGSEPPSSATKAEYNPSSKPAITGTGGATIVFKAYAIKDGMSDSQVLSRNYTITSPNAATPNIRIPNGVIDPGTVIFLTTETTDAQIHYTTNGSDPTASSTLYTGPFRLTATGTHTIKAIAIKSGFTDSGILTRTYTILNTATGDVTITDSNVSTMASVIQTFADSNPLKGTEVDPIIVKIDVSVATLLSGTGNSDSAGQNNSTPTNDGDTDPLDLLFDSVPSGKYVYYDMGGSTITDFGTFSNAASAYRSNHSRITGITLPASLITLGNSAFYRSNIKVFILPDGLTTIEAWAFADNTMMRFIDIPATVTAIGAASIRDTNFTALIMRRGISHGGITTNGGIYPYQAIIYVPADSVAAYKSGWNIGGINPDRIEAIPEGW